MLDTRRYPWKEIIAVASGLYHLRLERQIPPVFIDDLQITIVLNFSGELIRKALTWHQAARLVAGESLTDVLLKPIERKPANWARQGANRREYLRQKRMVAA